MKLLGDVIEGTLAAFGIRSCDACKKRKRKLNAADAKVRAKLRRQPCAECEKAKKIG